MAAGTGTRTTGTPTGPSGRCEPRWASTTVTATTTSTCRCVDQAVLTHAPPRHVATRCHVTRSAPGVSWQAAFIHAVGDLLQSVGVMIAAVIIWCAPPCRASHTQRLCGLPPLRHHAVSCSLVGVCRAAPSWKVADPLCTFLFSVLVLFTTWPVFKKAVRMLLNVVPDSVDLRAMHADLVSVEVRAARGGDQTCGSCIVHCTT